jgi:methylmalonyl-CoA/ethylmalonyl-CoA epimerase
MGTGYLRIDHLGIAVSDLDSALSQYRDVLGFAVEGREVHEGEQVEIAFLRVGESRLELIAPCGDSPKLRRYLDKRGEGIHHLCLAVPDLDARMAQLRQAGAELLDESPRVGAGGTRVAFLHPRSARGVLIELVEDRAGSEAQS